MEPVPSCINLSPVYADAEFDVLSGPAFQGILDANKYIVWMRGFDFFFIFPNSFFAEKPNFVENILSHEFQNLRLNEINSIQ